MTLWSCDSKAPVPDSSENEEQVQPSEPNQEIPANAAYVRFCWADYPYIHVDTGEQVDLGGKINAVWIK